MYLYHQVDNIDNMEHTTIQKDTHQVYHQNRFTPVRSANKKGGVGWSPTSKLYLIQYVETGKSFYKYIIRDLLAKKINVWDSLASKLY